MTVRDLVSIAAILSLTSVPVVAGPKGSAAPKAAAPKTTTHGSPKTTTTTSSAPKTTSHGSPKTTTTTASAPKGQGASAATHGSPKTTTSGASKAHGNPKKATTTTATTSPTPTSTSTSTSTSSTTTSGSNTSTGTSTTSTTSSSSTTTTAAPLNPIAQKISSKSQLSSKVQTMLPRGMSLDQASKGFKNQGQFIAALHVSQNLGIPFADLKTAMTGIRPVLTQTGGSTTTLPSTTTVPSTTTPTSTTPTTSEPVQILSLGQAIKKLRPSANADAATTTATRQATTDLGGR